MYFFTWFPGQNRSQACPRPCHHSSQWAWSSSYLPLLSHQWREEVRVAGGAWRRLTMTGAGGAETGDWRLAPPGQNHPHLQALWHHTALLAVSSKSQTPIWIKLWNPPGLSPLTLDHKTYHLHHKYLIKSDRHTGLTTA